MENMFRIKGLKNIKDWMSINDIHYLDGKCLDQLKALLTINNLWDSRCIILELH
jgi:hypothetical protein